MARGDLTIFEEMAVYFGGGMTSQTGMDFESGGDTFKLAMIDNTTAPTAADTTPIWGDYSANEVSGTGYTAGGEALTTQTWTEAAGVATFDADDVSWTQNGAGPTDCYWQVLYDDTITNPVDPAVCFVDMAGPVSLQDGDITTKWNASGVMTLTVT
jgi:hypothetical protein